MLTRWSDRAQWFWGMLSGLHSRFTILIGFSNINICRFWGGFIDLNLKEFILYYGIYSVLNLILIFKICFCYLLCCIKNTYFFITVCIEIWDASCLLILLFELSTWLCDLWLQLSLLIWTFQLQTTG